MKNLYGPLRAERAFRGIRDRRFWIFTHPFNSYLADKTQDIIEGRNPRYREVKFD